MRFQIAKNDIVYFIVSCYASDKLVTYFGRMILAQPGISLV